MLTFSADNLHFDHDEFAALVADTPLAALDADQLARLERRAGGWAAGLQILLQASRNNGLRSLENSQALVADDFWEYIEQEVLHNLPPHEVDFLIDISLLPFLTPRLCAAVTGLPSAECELLLRRIAAANTLVTMPNSLDAGRIHAVLRDFLLRRLMQHHSTDVLRAMRRRAAGHLADAGEIDAALDMLLPPQDSAGEPSLRWLGDDFDAAADLVEHAGHAALAHGELVAVRRWMRKLPDAVVRTRPRLAVDSAWMSIHLVEPGSDRALQHIHDALRASPEHADDALRAEVVAIETIRSMIDGRIADAWNSLQRARAMAIPENSLPAAYLDLCSGYLLSGPRRSLDERVRDFHRAADTFARIGFLRGHIEALCLEVNIRRIYAAGGGILASAARLRTLLDETDYDPGVFRIILNREVGDALYSMNQIDAARSELRKLLPSTQQLEQPTEHVYSAQVRLHLCDLADGTPLAIDDDDDEREWNIALRFGSPVIVFFIGLRRIQRDMLRGRPDLCWRTVTSLGISPPDLTPSTPMPHVITVLAGALFTGRHLDILAPLLIEFRARMDAVGHRFFKLQAHALLVQLHLVQRNPKIAREELRTLLADLEPTGFVRIVLDLPMLHLLLKDIDTPFAAQLAKLASVTRVTPASISSAERRIIRQLAEGGSAAEIAKRLFLSRETVRSHIRNIYAKLDVHDRTHALERAREMGIL